MNIETWELLLIWKAVEDFNDPAFRQSSIWGPAAIDEVAAKVKAMYEASRDGGVVAAFHIQQDDANGLVIDEIA